MEERGGSSQVALLDRRARTIRMCSLDALSEGSTWPLPPREMEKNETMRPTALLGRRAQVLHPPTPRRAKTRHFPVRMCAPDALSEGQSGRSLQEGGEGKHVSSRYLLDRRAQRIRTRPSMRSSEGPSSCLPREGKWGQVAYGIILIADRGAENDKLVSCSELALVVFSHTIGVAMRSHPRAPAQ